MTYGNELRSLAQDALEHNLLVMSGQLLQMAVKVDKLEKTLDYIVEDALQDEKVSFKEREVTTHAHPVVIQLADFR